MADEDQLTEPWPGYRTKAEMEAWFPTATPGEQKAVSEVVKAYQAWQRDPANGWFGMDINPAYIQGVIRKLAKQYDAPLRWCTYNILPR